ncbi:hypothetical protein ACFVAJ_18310 [Agromyces sp. NPDC057679]|uniref:hypothetical protein n=1 Tax=Agromyces sp. NPDC057679 TaxID=3346207 RepID=UPI00366F47EA
MENDIVSDTDFRRDVLTKQLESLNRELKFRELERDRNRLRNRMLITVSVLTAAVGFCAVAGVVVTGMTPFLHAVIPCALLAGVMLSVSVAAHTIATFGGRWIRHVTEMINQTNAEYAELPEVDSVQN